MATKLGTWTWITNSTDSDLNGVTGGVSVVASGLPGMLMADPQNPAKWRFTDGDYTIPMAFRMEFFSEPASASAFSVAADFLKNDVRGHMYETRLLEEYGQFGGRHDFIFEGDWRNHQFDLDQWDQMEERMEILTSRGLGAHIMFYSDQAGAPGWSAQSDTEALVIRYVVARLAGYPIVWFNSGIDIGEYRSNNDVQWWGQQVQALDPYDHPVSSRENSTINYSNETFDSQADPNQARVGAMISTFNDSSIPVSFDDAWGENRGDHQSKDHRPEDIRRAFWKATVAGGVGGLVRGGGDGMSRSGFYSIHNVASDLESEQWLKLINPFVTERLSDDFGRMVPAPELIAGNEAYALADPARNKILVVLLGSNDRYDTGGGGDVIVDLTDVAQPRSAIWFDPRTGNDSSAGTLSAGNSHTVSPPNDDDWVLLLTVSAVNTSIPAVPANL